MEPFHAFQRLYVKKPSNHTYNSIDIISCLKNFEISELTLCSFLKVVIVYSYRVRLDIYFSKETLYAIFYV